MENYRYWQAINSRFWVLRFKMHASEIKVVSWNRELQLAKKRKITEPVWDK